MKRILFMLSPGRTNTEAFHWCLHKAKEGKKMLCVTYIVDDEVARAMEMSLAETGFVGDKQGEELRTALQKEYVERGKKILEDMEKQARSFDVEFKTDLQTGSYLDFCENMANEEGVDTMVIIERKGKFLKKLFEGTEGDQLKDRIACEMKVYPAK